MARDEEEGEWAGYPNLENDYISYGYGNSILFWCSSICKALLQKACLVLRFWRPRKTADPLLPIQNPAPNEPLLVPTPLSNASILENAFECLIDLRGIDDEKAHIVESDHDMAVSVAEISNQEIVEEVPPTNLSSLDESVGLLNSREEEEEEEEVQIKSIVAVFSKRKIKHYNNQHKILLVGEGDFSFSACLAVAFGSATNIIATSLNSKAFLEKNYGSALSNIAELRRRGSKVMHGVDATKMGSHKLLAHLKFDRIVFNFPFAGFFPNLSRESELRRHRRLVRLFVKNAKEMMGENGEIHISHKTNSFHAEFNLESIACSQGLRLIAAVKFKCGNYPGYNTKYGFGGDANFNCYPSKTFKFGL